jgi:oligosaccharide repeat unit polymerase
MYEIALVLSVVCFLGVSIYFVRMPAFSIFHPLTIYLMFHGFVFVFRPILAYFNDFRFIYTLYQFTPSPADKVTVVLAATLGMLAFAFFSLQTGHAPMRFKQDAFAIAERNRLVPAALWTLAICVPIGLISLFWRYDQAAQDINDMVMDRGTGTFINTSSNGYLAEAQLMLATACAMIGWLFRFRLLALLPLVAFILVRAGTGGRGPFVTAAVCLSLLWLYEHRKRIPTFRAMLGILAVVTLFVSVGPDRGRAIRLAFGEDNSSERYDYSDQLKFLEGMDFGNLEYFEYLVYAVPQRTGSYEYFADNLMLFTEPVPRALWPDKPIGSPVKFFELFDYGFPIGMTRSLPGEGWTQLGWLGVIIWCGLWGLAFGALYRRFITSGQSTFWVMAYMTFIAMLVVVYRDGTVITIMRQGLFYFMPILLWWCIAKLLDVPRAARLRAEFLAAKDRTASASPLTSESQPGRAQAPGASSRNRQSLGRASVMPQLPPAVLRRRLKLLANKQARET